ncbi:Histone H2A.J [Trichinella patagoniensis]|uniref:Histone H2A n=1 Tax=Trichinella patagoniensis TaxID=990121 RepID=A0A0V1ACD6_9BILA|nr:Histone H2A.J [Trichinella patagoniensis]
MPDCSKRNQIRKAKSRSKQAGLQFSVSRVHRLLKIRRYSEHTGAGAPVYLAAVMQYLTAEILELAGNTAHKNKKNRISPRHLQQAIHNDEELNKFFTVAIAQGGALRNAYAPHWPQNDEGLSERMQSLQLE